MNEEFSEQQRAKVLGELKAAHPDVDIEGLIAGNLAGPASEDRPPVPVWKYLDYLADHPDLSLDVISRVRFPIVLHDGTQTVSSIAELTVPGPKTPTYAVTPEDVVRLYQLKHEAGAMRWDEQARVHVETKPAASYAKSVAEKWRHELEAKGRRRH